MAGYIWATIGFGLGGIVTLTWLMGLWPDWAYPPNVPNKVVVLVYLGALALSIGFIGTAAVMADRAQRYAPPCVAEDGGPLPCEWDGGVTENGYRMVIRYERVD